MALLKRNEKELSWLNQAKREEVHLDVSEKHVREKLDMLNIKAFDLQLMKVLRPYIEKKMGQMAYEFYANLTRIDAIKKIIETHSSVEKLSKTLSIHMMNLFSGVIDDRFVKRRYHVGLIHYQIGLSPSKYMGSFCGLLANLNSLVLENAPDIRTADTMIRSLGKLISFEQQLVLHAYDKEYERAIKEEYNSGREDLRLVVLHVSEQLAQLSEQNKVLVDRLTEQFNDVLEISKKRNELSEKAREGATTGQKQLELLFVQVMETNQSIQEMGKMVGDLEASSKQIGQVTLLVKDVSEQTHILAINSAIEAARAGEYGRGFAVVAQEIQKLADETNRAMVEISDLIQKSTEMTREVATSLDKTNKVIQKSMEESQRTGERFETLIDAARENGALSQETNESIQALEELTKELNAVGTTLAASAEKLKSKL